MEKKIRVAINGFGRIGRLCFKEILKRQDMELVAINDLTDPNTLLHLLKYDSVHGRFDKTVDLKEDTFHVANQKVKICSEPNPEKLPWSELKIDIVIESTGRFVSDVDAGKHLSAGAKKVIISAPAKGNVKTVVLGVNEEVLGLDDHIVSNASCTTNCLAPMVKVIHQKFGLEKGYISTVHAYTADQNLQDAPHRDLRRARAAALSIIPTSTGAAAAVGKVLPQLNGKLDGIALRVPTPDGSLTDFTGIVSREVTMEELNQAFLEASEGPMKGILAFNTDPLVSIDIIGNPHSCIIDSELTAASGTLVKVVAWYDNEYGYSCRTVDLVNRLGRFL